GHSVAGQKGLVGRRYSAGRLWTRLRFGTIDGHGGSNRRAADRLMAAGGSRQFLSQSIFVDAAAGPIGCGFVLVTGAGKADYRKTQAVIFWRNTRVAHSLSQ